MDTDTIADSHGKDMDTVARKRIALLPLTLPQRWGGTDCAEGHGQPQRARHLRLEDRVRHAASLPVLVWNPFFAMSRSCVDVHLPVVYDALARSASLV